MNIHIKRSIPFLAMGGIYEAVVRVTASFHWNSKTWSHELEVTGTEASVRWWPCDAGPVTLTVCREVTQMELPPADNVHAPLIADFVSAVEEGREPLVTAAQATFTNRLLDAVYQSASEHREVRLP